MKKRYKILFTALAASLLIFAAAFPALAEDIYADASVSEGAKNIFGVIYENALAYSAEIFSFLSLIGTLILSRFYKNGLLPTVKSTLGSLGSTVVKIKESSERQCESQSEYASAINEKLRELEASLARYGENLRALEEHLQTEEKSRIQREKTDKILLSQVDMLYDIFMTSSIPHYQKEATGERINRMRKEIGGLEDA